MKSRRENKNKTDPNGTWDALVRLSFLVLPTLVFIVPLVIYWPVLSVGFIADDFGYTPFFDLSTKEMAQGIAAIRAGLLEFYPFRPVVILSFRLDYLIWGVDPVGFHLTNLILHAANALMLYYLARLLGFSQFVAAVAGLLFGLYPAHPDAVTWISGRFDVLALTWLLGAFLLWCGGRLRDDKRFIAASVAAFIIALFAKEATAAGLLVLPLIDWFLHLETSRTRGKGIGWHWKGYFAYLLAVFVMIGTRFWLYGDLGGYQDPTLVAGYFGQDFATVWENLVVRDLWMLFTPVNRVALGDWGFEWYFWLVAVGITGGFSLLVSLARAPFRKLDDGKRAFAAIVLGFVWIIAFLLPVAPIAGVDELLEFSRYLYIPAAGLALWLGAAFGFALRGRGFQRGWSIVLLVSVLILSGFALKQHNRIWLESSAVAGGVHATLEAHTSDLPDNSDIFIVNLPTLWKGAHFRPEAYGAYLNFRYGKENVQVHYLGKPPEHVKDWWESIRMRWQRPGVGFEWDEDAQRLRLLGFVLTDESETNSP